jgi:hypothetical protein
MKIGDLVYLKAKTITAPLLCYSQPAAEIVAIEEPYIILIVQGGMGVRHRIHRDNVTRTAPKPPKPPVPKERAPLPDGFEEAGLW